MREESWIGTACRRDVVRRSFEVALVVGTILVVINQGDAILTGKLTGELILKSVLTYLVPYCVSTYAAVQAIRSPTE